MTRVFNFGAGPATLPEEVLRQAAADLRELLATPANYKVLLQGGALVDLMRTFEARHG